MPPRTTTAVLCALPGPGGTHSTPKYLKPKWYSLSKWYFSGGAPLIPFRERLLYSYGPSRWSGLWDLLESPHVR